MNNVMTTFDSSDRDHRRSMTGDPAIPNIDLWFDHQIRNAGFIFKGHKDDSSGRRGSLTNQYHAGDRKPTSVRTRLLVGELRGASNPLTRQSRPQACDGMAAE